MFGIDCRRDADGVDCAEALAPVFKLGLATTSLNRHLPDLLSPHHDGIRISPIPTNSGEGFLVIEVPRSPRRPHMAAIEKSYYRRISTSTMAMDHYDVEDAFRWQTAPELDLHWDLAGGE